MLGPLKPYGIEMALVRFVAIAGGIALTWTCAAFGLGMKSTFASRHNDEVARWRVRAVDHALTLFSIDKLRCPGTRGDLIKAGSVKPADLVDPWGTSIAYWCSDEAARAISAGADRLFGTDDDVTSPR